MELVTTTATAMLLLTLVALMVLLLPPGGSCQAATATAMVGYGMVGAGAGTSTMAGSSGTGLGVVYRLGVLAGRALMLMPPSILVLGIGWMWMPLQGRWIRVYGGEKLGRLKSVEIIPYSE